VRLGIDAPKNVHILRHEVADDGQHELASAELETQKLSHAARNHLHTALLALALIQRRMELGDITAAEIDSQIAGVIAQLEQLEAEVTPRPIDPPCGQTASLAPRKKALVVEDNANERTLLVDYLQTCNYDVETASDGQDALDYLATHGRPDVVLLDMTMPRLDGRATVREIRSNPQLHGVKLIAVSGMSARQAAVDLGPAGVDRWFIKPVRAHVLVQEMDRVTTPPR
jgi:CheY-like chemotaxis protein